jgi:hypothetical protein
MGTPTQVFVRVIAKGGKYLGDDIGGALVTIEDVRTGELLKRGFTSGGSGPQDLMDVRVKRSEVWPINGASVFPASLDLDGPRLIRVTAYGPLAAQQSANTVSLTQWVFPVRDKSGVPEAINFLLELPGLVVQVLNPPTHFMPAKAPQFLEVRANVTMMCGCPTGTKYWPAEQFHVWAAITQPGGYRFDLLLTFEADRPDGAPSQFVGTWRPPQNTTGQLAIYEITVTAFQPATGNAGSDRATLIIAVPSTKDEPQS